MNQRENVFGDDHEDWIKELFGFEDVEVANKGQPYKCEILFHFKEFIKSIIKKLTK